MHPTKTDQIPAKCFGQKQIEEIQFLVALPGSLTIQLIKIDDLRHQTAFLHSFLFASFLFIRFSFTWWLDVFVWEKT